MNITHSFVEVVPKIIMDMSDIETIFMSDDSVVMYSKRRSHVTGDKVSHTYKYDRITDQFKGLLQEICRREPWKK